MKQDKTGIIFLVTLLLALSFFVPAVSSSEDKTSAENLTAASSPALIVSQQDSNRRHNDTDAYGFRNRTYPWSDISPDSSYGTGADAQTSELILSAADSSGPWTLMNASAGWSTRGELCAVVTADGNIVLMGGGREYSGMTNDVWRSTDKGATWTRIVANAPWAARSHHSAVVMPDGSIVLMGGWNGAGTYMNDVWRSADNGSSWSLMTSSPGWSARFGQTAVALYDGSIVLMGGVDPSARKNDVWRSVNNGLTWSLVTTSPGWTARYAHASVALPDGSIVLMGGNDIGGLKHDVWRSANNGSTWMMVNASAGWTGRNHPATVVMKDNSIMLIGGADATFKSDVWQSRDNGTTWALVNASAGWPARYAPAAVVMPDSSVVMMGGVGPTWPAYLNDVWRYVPAPVADFTATPITGTIPLTVHFTDMSSGSPTSWLWDFGDSGTSTNQNPVHTYNTYGTHTVNLTVTASGGSNSRVKPAYIMGTGGTYRVFVEGVGDYRGTADNLTDTVPLASAFYDTIQGSNGEATWTGYEEHYNENAGSKFWSVSELSLVKADNADFALFAGHGNKTMIAFGTANSQQQLTADDMEFGTVKAKWVTLASCLVLNESTRNDLTQVFKGLHILNGYDTEGFPYGEQGTQFAQRMKGDGYQVETIRDAWMHTLKNTINIPSQEHYNGAWMWAEPCSEDYLPGYGKFCSVPTASDGQYDTHYDRFNCV